MNRRSIASAALLVATLAAGTDPTTADAAPTARPAAEVHTVTSSSPVRSCPADFQHLDRNGRPTRTVHAPSTVSRPVGLRLPDSMALYGVANDRRIASRGGGSLAYQSLAGPTAFACSGIAGSQDDVSWASFRSRTASAHSITATFMQGQEAFPALCEYLLAAHRPAAARAWAHTFAAKAGQCRKWTNDTPVSARIRQVRVTARRFGPTVIVIHAPKGAELSGPAVTSHGNDLSRPRTTTPTVSVALFSYRSTTLFTWPQTLDCSLPSTRPHACAAAAAVFVDEALQGSYNWGPRGAARAARKVASALG
jgi:hypothetical protein